MATIRVTNQTELDAAVKAAKAGDTVVLAAGNYKQLWVDDKTFATPVTFKSESSTNPAVIGYARTIRSDGVVFEGLKVGREMVPGVDQDWSNMALVQESKNVTWKNVTFFATGADAKYLGRGLFVRDSANVTVTGSDFSHMSVGMCSMTTNGLVVQNNKFHDLRIDGAEFTAVTNVLVDGNDFRDFRSSTVDHPDAIQFWTRGSKTASTDIVVSNNVIMPGTGAGSQGIFIQDEVGGLAYERVTIKNNLLLDAGSYWNGITVRGGKDVVIEGNTSISPTTDKNVFWIRLDNVDGAKVTGNLADQMIQSNLTNLQQSGNVFLKEQASYVSKISGINLGASATVSSLIVSGVGYQSSGSSIAPVTSTQDPALLSPTAQSPITQVTSNVASDTQATTSSATTTTSSTSLTSLEPTSLASTLTPIATTPTITTAAAPVVATAPAATTTTATVAAPVLTAKQQKAAAKAAAAAAKAQAKAAAAAAKAAAKAAKSSKTGTSIAVTPVVSQPVIPVAAAPIASISTISSSTLSTSGWTFAAGGF